MKTRKDFVRFTKDRTKESTLKNILDIVKNEVFNRGAKCLVVHTDNAPEFACENTLSELNKLCIDHSTTAPYSSTINNGIVE